VQRAFAGSDARDQQLASVVPSSSRLTHGALAP
jgi:hypothetical protein